MGNCLKTQLKSVVNNDNLNYYGGITFDFNNTTVDSNMFLNMNTNMKVKAITGAFDVLRGETVISSNVTEFTPPSADNTHTFKPSVANTKLLMTDKYVSTLSLFITPTTEGLYYSIFDISQLEYINMPIYLVIDNASVTAKGKLNVGKLNNVENIENFTLELSTRDDASVIIPESVKFRNLTRMRLFTPGFGGYSDVTMNISSFDQCLNLIDVNLYRCESVTGNLNTLLDSLYTNGKISGSCNFSLEGTQVTYNGSEIYGLKTFIFSASGWSES